MTDLPDLQAGDRVVLRHRTARGTELTTACVASVYPIATGANAGCTAIAWNAVPHHLLEPGTVHFASGGSCVIDPTQQREFGTDFVRVVDREARARERRVAIMAEYRRERAGAR